MPEACGRLAGGLLGACWTLAGCLPDVLEGDERRRTAAGVPCGDHVYPDCDAALAF